MKQPMTVMGMCNESYKKYIESPIYKEHTNFINTHESKFSTIQNIINNNPQLKGEFSLYLARTKDIIKGSSNTKELDKIKRLISSLDNIAIEVIQKKITPDQARNQIDELDWTAVYEGKREFWEIKLAICIFIESIIDIIANEISYLKNSLDETKRPKAKEKLEETRSEIKEHISSRVAVTLFGKKNHLKAIVSNLVPENEEGLRKTLKNK